MLIFVHIVPVLNPYLLGLRVKAKDKFIFQKELLRRNQQLDPIPQMRKIVTFNERFVSKNELDESDACEATEATSEQTLCYAFDNTSTFTLYFLNSQRRFF